MSDASEAIPKDAASSPPPRVAVCVATYKRPRGLKCLLEALGRLVFQRQQPELRIIVVDNDDAASARDVCHEAAALSPWPISYRVEPRRGIPFARNAAVALAADWAHDIAFIDDDEEPDPSWLDELLTVREACQADVVTGPVLPRFDADAPRWITQGRFFRGRRRPTGTALDVAMTNNVLARTEVFRRVAAWAPPADRSRRTSRQGQQMTDAGVACQGSRHLERIGSVHQMADVGAARPPFDIRLALTGGSDADFFRRAHLAGCTIIWNDEAIVWETVPPSRANLGWLLRHAYRIGNSWSFIETNLDRTWRSRTRMLGRSAARTLRGFVLLPLVLVAGTGGLARSLWNFCYAAGLVAGLAGCRYEEYRVTTGD